MQDNPDLQTRVDYELTYYVNDINMENTQVLMEYGKRDELKNVYTYGLERISVKSISGSVAAIQGNAGIVEDGSEVITADTTARTGSLNVSGTDRYEIKYYLYDGRGSVSSVITEAAEKAASYTYDPFGNVTSGAPEFESYYGYNGEETNPVTGKQYLRARYYDTENGRFESADNYLGSITQPLTLNRYSYTLNNPVMYTDPSGHLPAWTGPSTGKLIGNSIKNLANSVTVQSGKSSSVVGNSIRNLVSNTVENRTKPLVAGAPKAAMDALRDTTGKALSGIVSSWKTAGKEQGTSAEKSTASETYIQNKMDVVWQKIQEFACGSAKEVMAASIDQDSFLDNYFRFAKNQSIGVGVSLYVDLLEPFYEIKGAIEEIFTGSRNGYWADISDLNSCYPSNYLPFF